MDILGLGELAVRNGGHHAERREQCRPDCGTTPLDHLHHIPEGPNTPVVRHRPALRSTQAREQQGNCFILTEKRIDPASSPVNQLKQNLLKNGTD